MSLIVMFLLFIFGLILIIKGSDWFVDSAIWIAKVFRIPDIIIGATLVSFSTTLPELFVSTSSAINGDTSMALGNAMGSVACNTALILGFAIILTTPALLHKKTISIKASSISLLLLLIFSVGYINGYIPRSLGIILFLLTFVFIYYNYDIAKKHRKITKKTDNVDTCKKTVIKNIILFTVGLVFTIFGAHLIVVYGVKIAVELNVPSIIIGVSMTALGTSLPELVTSIAAIRKNAAALSIGNIFGANILNLTLVVGSTAIIKPIIMTKDILSIHLPIILGITLIIVIGTIISKKKYSKILGIILLSSYIGYMILNIIIAV